MEQQSSRTGEEATKKSPRRYGECNWRSSHGLIKSQKSALRLAQAPRNVTSSIECCAPKFKKLLERQPEMWWSLLYRDLCTGGRRSELRPKRFHKAKSHQSEVWIRIVSKSFVETKVFDVSGSWDVLFKEMEIKRRRFSMVIAEKGLSLSASFQSIN